MIGSILNSLRMLAAGGAFGLATFPGADTPPVPPVIAAIVRGDLVTLKALVGTNRCGGAMKYGYNG